MIMSSSCLLQTLSDFYDFQRIKCLKSPQQSVLDHCPLRIGSETGLAMISDDPYRTSTQYRLFSYPSPQDLLAQRTKTNVLPLSQLPADSTYLSVAEEIELVDYYVGRLWDLCRLFKVPSHVKVFYLLCLSNDAGHSNKLSPPLLPPQHPSHNTPKAPDSHSIISRRKNRKRFYSNRLLQKTTPGHSRLLTTYIPGIPSVIRATVQLHRLVMSSSSMGFWA